MSTSENLRNIGIALVVISFISFIIRETIPLNDLILPFLNSLLGINEGISSTFLEFSAFFLLPLGLILLVISSFVSSNRSNTRQIKKIEHTNPLRHRKSLMFIKPKQKQLKFIKPKSNKKFKLH